MEVFFFVSIIHTIPSVMDLTAIGVVGFVGYGRFVR